MEDVGALGVDAGVAKGDLDGGLGLDLLALEPEGDVDCLDGGDLVVGHGVDAVENVLGRDVLEAHLDAVGQGALGGVDGHLGRADVLGEGLLGVVDVLVGLLVTLNLSLRLGGLVHGSLVDHDLLGRVVDDRLLGIGSGLGSGLGDLGRRGLLGLGLGLELGFWLWCGLWLGLRRLGGSLLHRRRGVGDDLLLNAERLLHLVDRIRHSLEREQLQHETKREEPRQRLPQEGLQPAQMLVHDTSFHSLSLGCPAKSRHSYPRDEYFNLRL